MGDLLEAYPHLGDAITRLCGGQSWRFTGASALLLDATHLYLEITKPKHWRRRADGTLIAGIGAIGGSLEGDEGVLACLRREVREEIGAPAALCPARETYLVYEESTIETVTPEGTRVWPEGTRVGPEDLPMPALCTVSRNLYRRRALPDARVLAIATFSATPEAPPRRGDLFGLLAVPFGALDQVLAPSPPPVEGVCRIPGVRLETQSPLAGDALLAPVWTVRSLQLLMQAGCLPWPLPGRVPPL